MIYELRYTNLEEPPPPVPFRYPTHSSVHGREAGDGGSGELATASDQAARSSGNDDEADPEAKRVTGAFDLMETLLHSDVNVIESLRNLSRPLRVDDNDDGMVGEIARPVLAYAKRYKAPRVAREERHAAKKAAEAANPMEYLSAYARSPPNPGTPVVDMSPRELREPPPLPRGWDPTDFGGIRLDRPVGHSRRSREARARWQDPEYRERMLRKRKKKYAPRKKDVHDPGKSSSAKGSGTMPVTVEEIDQFLNVTNVTAKEAIRTYKGLSEGERRRRENISMRWKNPSKWLADRLAGAAEKQARLHDPEYLRQRMEVRSLKAKRAYETRRRNGNSGMGRPRSRVDHARALEVAARAAEARAAAIRAGYATEDDFVVPPEGKREYSTLPKVRKEDIPWVKRKPGRPRKVLTEEEQAKRAFSKAHPPRPRGRPRKVRLKVGEKVSLPALPRESASLKDAVVACMVEAGTRAAVEFPSVSSFELESRVEALAVARTKDVMGACKGEWSPQMASIAASGIEAWSEAWQNAGGTPLRACQDWGGEQREMYLPSGHIVDTVSLLDAATVAEADALAPHIFGLVWGNTQRCGGESSSRLWMTAASSPACQGETRRATTESEGNTVVLLQENAPACGSDGWNNYPAA